MKILMRSLSMTFFVLGLSACSVMPGFITDKFHAHSHQAPKENLKEADNDIAFKVFEVTPTLLDELNREGEEMEKNTNALLNQKELLKAQSDDNIYKIGRQDILRINVWGNPDLSNVGPGGNVAGNYNNLPVNGRVVDEKGEIYFPLVGSIQAADLSIKDFRAQLEKKLKKYLKDPPVEVEVASYRSQKVFVAGEVKTPSMLMITDQPMRITDAIALAGGFTPNADNYSVVLTRKEDSILIDLDPLYYKGDTKLNLSLKDGDFLTIPDNQSRKVFVLGEVGNSVTMNNAKSYIMRRGRVSLAEVLMDAGGINPNSANASEVYVMRLVNGNNAKIFKLDAKDPIAMVKAERFPIFPKDLVFVAPTDFTQFGRVIGQFTKFNTNFTSNKQIN